LQCCSRRNDEASIIFELELADQPTFKIIRVFNSNDNMNLWVVQLIGTHECVKLSKQFSHIKRDTIPSLTQWPQPEILFGQILIEMNEIDKAYTYFFQILINQYDRLNKIYAKANELWKQDKKYTEAVDCIATEFQQIKSTTSSNKTQEELTYLESEFDSTWESPIALQDVNKVNDLLAPISYRVDQVLFKESTMNLTTTTSTRRRCTLF
jgi:Tol biopolymer transport system component